jgi:geranylgeranyl diphosphate synthase type I
MKNLDTVTAYRPLVLEGLESFISKRRQLLGGLTWSADVIDRLDKFTGGGKLLRGSLICYSYALCGDGSETSIPPPVLNAATAIELIHAGLLMHDDIIDQDDLRRGQPAIHQQYRVLAGRQYLAEPSRLGENLGLCAGDMVLFLAFELLASAQSAAGGTALSELFVRELATVCAGQMQDIYLGASSKPSTKTDVYAVMRAKTATYSVALPLAAGAILAGQTAAMRRQLYAVGMAAGTMFQIRDDELGALGRSAEIGKPVGSDIREGKKTLLYYYLWRSVNAAERQRLQAIFGNQDADPADIAYVQKSMRRHNVPARLKEDIAKLDQTASSHINQLALVPKAKTELRQLVKFCAARKL